MGFEIDLSVVYSLFLVFCIFLAMYPGYSLFGYLCYLETNIEIYNSNFLGNFL